MQNIYPWPFAKKHFERNLVSLQKDLQTLYLKTFKDRLRHRLIKPGLEELKSLKEELCLKRIKAASMIKSDGWKMENLSSVLLKLKKDKSRDPHGLVNELFKPGVAGVDFQKSFLNMANKIKTEICIPKFMQCANIVSLYKGKGEKMDLQNIYFHKHKGRVLLQ